MTGKKISTDYSERMADPSLTFYEKFYGRSEHDVKRVLLEQMKEAGANRVEASYSGGHDEGGIQDMTVFDSSGNEIAVDSYNHPLWEACDAVLTTKFYSWALGMSVEGTLFVDMGEKRVWTEGQHEDWVQDDDPLEWRL